MFPDNVMAMERENEIAKATEWVSNRIQELVNNPISCRGRVPLLDGKNRLLLSAVLNRAREEAVECRGNPDFRHQVILRLLDHGVIERTDDRTRYDVNPNLLT